MESVSLAAASAASTATLFNGKKQVLLSSRGNACNPAFIARVERRMSTPALRTAPRRVAGQVSASADRTVVAAATSPGGQAPISALVFDCDGVILESEDLHRRAYNAAFAHFAIRCPGENAVVDWTTEFYDVLQNKIGGRETQDAMVPVRPGVLELIDEARQRVRGGMWVEEEEGERGMERARELWVCWWRVCWWRCVLQPPRAQSTFELTQYSLPPAYPLKPHFPPPRPLSPSSQGLLVAVCSAATKSSVHPALSTPSLPSVLSHCSFSSSFPRLPFQERFDRLDCFLAGDDVPKKKPDPTIYKIAAQVRLQHR
ncbi:unnamed protein product [Closterium sp. NIES-64]|nr:unnamed protein product [Closterium sp. NIES-64]